MLTDDYICYKCKNRYKINYDDKFCSYCGSKISRFYSKKFIDTEKKLKISVAKRLKAAENYENLEKSFENNIKIYDEFEKNINLIKPNIDKVFNDLKLKPDKFDKIMKNNQIQHSLLLKYINNLDSSFTKEMKYFVSANKSATPAEVYMEYIYMKDDERSKYDGIQNFEKIMFLKDNDQFRKVYSNGTFELFIFNNGNDILAFPAKGIYKSDYSERRIYSYYEMFDIKVVSLKKDKIENIERPLNFIPAVLVKNDSINYKLVKKGEIIIKKIISE